MVGATTMVAGTIVVVIMLIIMLARAATLKQCKGSP
jgi:hypothetical protein